MIAFCKSPSCRRTAGIAFLFLAVPVCIVFWPQISGTGVFIGESDRLNTYLSMRLLEFDSLHQYGRVPSWSPAMFGGFSLAALHWMNPGKELLPYLLQYLPREDVYWALGFTPILLVLAACLSAFAYIRDVTKTELPSLIGALGYGLSVFSVHRAAQVDNAHLTVVLIPLALLFLRRAGPANLTCSFVGLAAIMTALAYWGFLQEVAYAFVFFGAYALYRAGARRRSNDPSWFAPIAVIAAASVVALIFSAPRLITLGQEFRLLERTATLHEYRYLQLLRMFHEGIFGRYAEEGRLLGNRLGLHEGIQLVASSALSLFVCFGIIRPRTRMERIAAVIFVALLMAIFPIFGIFRDVVSRFVPISIELYSLLISAALLCLAAFAISRVAPGAVRRFLPHVPRPTDTTFHLFALVIVLVLILMPEGRNLVYQLFLRIDFTHARLSILAVLPLCTLFSIYLTELTQTPSSAVPEKRTKYWVYVAAIAVSALAAYAIHGPILERLISLDIVKIILADNLRLMPAVVAQIALSAVFLVVLAAIALKLLPKMHDRASIAPASLAAFVAIEIVLYAHLKIAGPQTWTFPTPFRNFNYFNVEPSVLRPPTQKRLAAFQREFEVDSYRMIVLRDFARYSATISSHVPIFWKARSVGGYSTGVPDRIARIPWAGSHIIRTIDFALPRPLNEPFFTLLALLNVKYLIALTPSVFFNVDSSLTMPGEDFKLFTRTGQEILLSSKNVDGINFKYFENPVRPLPRHFMVERMVGSSEIPEFLPQPYVDRLRGYVRVFQNQDDDLTRTARVEKFADGTTKTFDAAGDLDVLYKVDFIQIRVAPSESERLIILNQTYNPEWRAYSENKPIMVMPANAVMMAILLPPHSRLVELRFEPFSSTRSALAFYLAGFLAMIGSGAAFHYSRFRRTDVQ